MRLRIRSRVRERGISNLIDVKSRVLPIFVPKHVNMLIGASTTSESGQSLRIETKCMGKLRVREAKCFICYKRLQSTEELVSCPHCEMTFHQEHWEGWVQTRHRCPYCRQTV